MSMLKDIIIPVVHSSFTTEDIAEFFFENNIAELESITLMPTLHDGQVDEYNVAYISVFRWLEKSPPLLFALEFGQTVLYEITRNDMWEIRLNFNGSKTKNISGHTTKFDTRYEYYCGEEEQQVRF